MSGPAVESRPGGRVRDRAERLGAVVGRDQVIRIAALVEWAISEERAACARIAEAYAVEGNTIAGEIAGRIRARERSPGGSASVEAVCGETFDCLQK